MIRTTHRLYFQSAASMDSIEDESIDLVVTSPPYPMIEMWDGVFSSQADAAGAALAAGDGPAAFEEMHRLLDRVWEECYRVLKPGAFACINIGDATRKIGDNFRLYSNHSRITSFCTALGFQALPAVIWRKQTNGPNKFMGSGMLPSGAYVTLEHEYILIFRKGGKRVFSGADKTRRRESAFFWEERNRWFSDLWDFKGVRQRIHPQEIGSSPGGIRDRSAAFPFELAYRLICMYSLKGDTVLDPFLGTGTTMAAAVTAARNSCGVEIDSGFAESIFSQLQEGVPEMNRRIRERVTDHLSFIREYRDSKGKEPAHTNDYYGIPVITKQERELRLPLVESIESIDEAAGLVTARHRETPEIVTEGLPLFE